MPPLNRFEHSYPASAYGSSGRVNAFIDSDKASPVQHTQNSDAIANFERALTKRQVRTIEYLTTANSLVQAMAIKTLFTAILDNDHKTAKILLPGIPYFVINAKHDSALSTALWLSNPDTQMVQLLLRNRANPNIEIANGLQPLQRAVQIKRLDIATSLINAGGDPDIQASCGKNAMEFAKEMDWLPDYKRYQTPANLNYDGNDFTSDHDRQQVNQIYELLAEHSRSFEQDDMDEQSDDPEPPFEISTWRNEEGPMQQEQEQPPQQNTYSSTQKKCLYGQRRSSRNS